VGRNSPGVNHRYNTSEKGRARNRRAAAKLQAEGRRWDQLNPYEGKVRQTMRDQRRLTAARAARAHG
jgi:hypothetical protein